MLLNGGVDGCDGKDASILVGTIALLSAFRGCNIGYRWRVAGCQQHLSLPLFADYPHLFNPTFIHYPIDLIVPKSFLLLDTWVLAVLVVDTTPGSVLLALLGDLVKGIRMSSVVVGVEQTCWCQ